MLGDVHQQIISHILPSPQAPPLFFLLNCSVCPRPPSGHRPGLAASLPVLLACLTSVCVWSYLLSCPSFLRWSACLRTNPDPAGPRAAVGCSVGSVDPVLRSAATSGYWVSDGSAHFPVKLVTSCLPLARRCIPPLRLAVILGGLHPVTPVDRMCRMFSVSQLHKGPLFCVFSL